MCVIHARKLNVTRECDKRSTLTRLVDSGFHLMVARQLVFCDSYYKALLSDALKIKVFLYTWVLLRVSALKLLYLDIKSLLNYLSCHDSKSNLHTKFEKHRRL